MTSSVDGAEYPSQVSAATDLATMIRAQLILNSGADPDGVLIGWSEQTEPGWWWWRRLDDASSSNGDSANEIILEGRNRRVRTGMPPGVTLGPTVGGYADGVAFQLDLPHVVDKYDLRRVLDVLKALGAL